MNAANTTALPYAIAAGGGLAVCLLITLTTGRREAWDSGAYFSIGIPLMCLLIFALGYRFPVKAWRWTLSMAVGQSVALLLGGGSLSLWPLSLIALFVLSAPQFAAGLVASRLAGRKRTAS